MGNKIFLIKEFCQSCDLEDFSPPYFKRKIPQIWALFRRSRLLQREEEHIKSVVHLLNHLRKWKGLPKVLH